MSETNIPSEIKEMDKAVKCLRLELHESIADDVQRIWEAAKAQQASTIAALEAENERLKGLIEKAYWSDDIINFKEQYGL